VGLTLRDNAGAEVDRQVTWMQRDCKWHEMLKIEPTKLVLSVESHSSDASETTYHLLAENKSSVPAVNAALSVLAGERGAEVLPCFWNDNSFTLLPGEKKHLTVTFRTGLLKGKEPHLIAEGWNLLPTEIGMMDSKPVDLGVKIVKIAGGDTNETIKVTAESSDRNPEISRIVTWPLMLELNGKPVRTFRVAVHGQGQSLAEIPVDWLGSGDKYTVNTGAKS
jgi:hypothetical protein